MKFKNTILSLSIIFAFVLALTLVSATVTVNYNMSSAIIEDNGNWNITNSIAVSDAYVDGYVCVDVACTTVGAAVPGLTSYTAGSTMSVVYPDNLPASGRYVLYFHKDGYIGAELIANWNSPDLGNYNVNSNQIIYLSKRRNGWAPIMNLSVTEETPTNRPIRIGFNVSLDADTYSALTRNTVSNVALNETVETFVAVVITNSSGATVYSANQTVNIPYSQSVPVNFTFVPGFIQTGTYGVALATGITDEKIMNSVTQSTASGINVIPQVLTNYTYTLLSNLQASPSLPRLGDNVVFSMDYLSGYINESNDYLAANTTLGVSITRNGPTIYTNSVNLNESGTYSFNQVFSLIGSYVITVTGTPNDARGNLTLPSSQSYSFIVAPAYDGSTVDDNTHHHTTPKNHTTQATKLSDSLPLTNSTGVIDLTPKEESSFMKKFLLWLLIAVILLILAVSAVYIVKFVKE